MDRKLTLWALLDLIILIVFNTLFFAAGGNKPASVWISYVGIHIAYLMFIATPFLIKRCNKDSIFGIKINNIAMIYFFVEFIAGLIFVLLKQETIKGSLVFQVVITAIYAIMIILHMIFTERNDSNNDIENE